VSDWEQSEPVGDQLATIVGVVLNDSVLELDNLSDRCNCVVTGVVVHGHLLLLSLDLGSDGEVNSSLERLQAQIRARLESITSVLSNDTDSVS